MWARRVRRVRRTSAEGQRRREGDAGMPKGPVKVKAKERNGNPPRSVWRKRNSSPLSSSIHRLHSLIRERGRRGAGTYVIARAAHRRQKIGNGLAWALRGKPRDWPGLAVIAAT